jgi:hypothetical protein
VCWLVKEQNGDRLKLIPKVELSVTKSPKGLQWSFRASKPGVSIGRPIIGSIRLMIVYVRIWFRYQPIITGCQIFEIRNCTSHWEKQCMAMRSFAFCGKSVGKDKIAVACQVLISLLPI